MALSALQRRDLRLLASLRGISVLGDAIALVTLYLRVAHGGHGWMIAALSVAGALPIVVLAPLAGHVVDHAPAKALLASLCGAEALVCVGIGFWHGGVATIALMTLLTCGVAFSLPGYSALAPTVSGEENVAMGQSTIQSVQGVALAAGPVFGGLLVGLVGTSIPLYVDAASFALAGLGTLLLQSDRRPTARATSLERPERDLGAGIRLILRDPLMRPVVVLVTVIFSGVGALNVVEVFFITRTLHASALLYGVAGASFGGGGVVGALASRHLHQNPRGLMRTSLASIAVISVMLGSVGLVYQVTYIFPLMATSGVAAGVVNVAATTLFALRTPEALRGRVYAAIGAIFTSAEIGSMVLGGVLLSVLAPRTIYLLCGLVCTVAVVVIGPLELRRSGRMITETSVAQGD
ncbi:MAG: MFS transporter [Acidimicrobiales bacterium]